jgi:hypothetical protein
MSAFVSRTGEARRLDRARVCDARLDGRGGLTGPAIRELLVGDPWHVEMDVDAVQQRATDPLLIAVDGPRRTGAGAPRVASVAAGTRIHRGDQGEVGREGQRAGGTGQRHSAVLQRLA